MKKILKGFLYILFFAMSICYAMAGVQEVQQNIINQANEMGVDPAIVLSIAKTESGFNPNAKSAGGHIGLFQLSPATAKHLGYNPYNMDENIKAGITYYKNMYKKFGTTELAVAAYNAGPIAIQRCNNTIPARTQPYVNKIMKNYNYYKSQGI